LTPVPGERSILGVTGAGGYVGSRLVPLLVARPATDVRVLTRHPLRLPAGVEQVAGDVRDPDDATRLCDGASAVVHLAGPNEVASARDPEVAAEELLAGAFALAEAARRSRVGRVVYVSTVHVYGARLGPGAVVDEDTACEPRAAYAIGRLAAEHVLHAYGPPGLVVFRLTNSVGAPASVEVDRWTLVVNDLCRQAAVEGRMVLRTDGSQSRDFVPLADVCRILAGATEPRSVDAGTYNLGSGMPLSIRDIAGLVGDAFVAAGRPAPPLVAPDPPPVLPPAPVVIVDRLTKAGWRAEGSVAGAVAETARFCMDHREELAHQATGGGSS
jgi:UDP-glucose 4-epimerase